MFKATITVSALALAAVSLQGYQRPTLPFKEEAMTIEYTATSDEAVIVIAAETEEVVRSFRIKGPQGTAILDMRSESGKPVAVSGFVLEMAETTKQTVFADYSAGRYDIQGRTLAGQKVVGSATLSHLLLRPPALNYPKEGDQGVPIDDLVVSWAPVQHAVCYRVGIEQGETDGIVVVVPPTKASFKVPEGLLLPDTETQVEVGAVGANGNCTLVEAVFRTQ
jgi:hypothetical protein